MQDTYVNTDAMSDIGGHPFSGTFTRRLSIEAAPYVEDESDESHARDLDDSEEQWEKNSVADGEDDRTGPFQDYPLPRLLTERIPLEVFEGVIDRIDRCMLPIAALVSWAWHPRAMHNLYCSIEIASRTSYDLLVEQSRTSTRIKRWLTNTHELVIRSHKDAKLVQGDTPFLDALPLVFASGLPALRALKVYWVLRPVMHPTFYLALSHFGHLTLLCLTLVQLYNTLQLRRIISAFPQLEALALSRVSFRQPLPAGPRYQHPADPSLRPESGIRLKRLDILASDYEASQSLEYLVDWLVCSSICASLSDLAVELRFVKSADYRIACDQVDRLLRESGPSLTCFRETHGTSLGHPGYEFAHNTSLHRLKSDLNVGLRQPEENWPAVVANLRATLSSVRSHALAHITLDFYVWLADGLEPEKFTPSGDRFDSQLRSLHDVAVRPYFDALRSVDVRMRIYYSPGEQSKELADDVARAVVPMLRRLLRPWHDRGIVNVSYKGWSY